MQRLANSNATKKEQQAVTIHQGDLVAAPGVVYEFEEISGSLDARGADTKTAFPKLTTVGGYLDARGADTKTAFPKLTTVGGYLDASGADTKTAFPKLTKTDSSEAAESIRSACRKILFEAMLASGFYFADGILSKLVSRRGRVARVVICGKQDVSYIVEDGRGSYSHGATLAEAKRGLIYKLTSRDTSEFKAWKPKTVVTIEEAIQAYRAITGACEGGVRGFCERLGELPEKITVAEIITRTKGQYGNAAFARFFGVEA